MAPTLKTPALNVAFPPRPSVMDPPHTNIKSSTITPKHIPSNIISHAAFLQDSEPLDPSFKRILEYPTYTQTHTRSIPGTHNLENDTFNTTGFRRKEKLQREISPAIITFIIISVLLVIGIIGCNLYRRNRQRVETKKQQDEERWSDWNVEHRKKMSGKGELMEMDLGELGIAVVEYVEYADVESVKKVPKERRRSGSDWMRFWR